MLGVTFASTLSAITRALQQHHQTRCLYLGNARLARALARLGIDVVQGDEAGVSASATALVVCGDLGFAVTDVLTRLQAPCDALPVGSVVVLVDRVPRTHASTIALGLGLRDLEAVRTSGIEIIWGTRDGLPPAAPN